MKNPDAMSKWDVEYKIRKFNKINNPQPGRH